MLANVCTWYVSAKGKSLFTETVILCYSSILLNKSKQQQEIICNSRYFPNYFSKEDKNHYWEKKKLCGELSEMTKSISYFCPESCMNGKDNELLFMCSRSLGSLFY